MRTRVRGGFRTIDTAHLLADVDLAAILAADGVALRKESTGSEKAPCPRCVGDDRFVYKWNTDGPPRCWCRQCWPKGGDAIGYIRWRDNCDFRAACEWLARFNGRSLDWYRR